MSNASTTTRGVPTPNRVTTNPGEVLKDEFLKPLGMSVNALATALRVPATRIGAIAKGKRSVTADTALRLARFFGTSPEFWISLQATHDLAKARTEGGAAIERDVRPRATRRAGAAWNRAAHVPSFGRLLTAAPLAPGDPPKRNRAPMRRVKM